MFREGHNFLSTPHLRWLIDGSCGTLFQTFTATLEISSESGLELLHPPYHQSYGFYYSIM